MRYFAFLLLFFPFAASGCSYFKSKPEEPQKVSIRDIIKEQGYKVTVYFEINSDKLSLVSQDSIMRTAKLLAISNTKAYLTGFADKTGNKKQNITLSRQRVDTVKAFLEKLGVPEENIYVDYFGDELPVDDADTPEAYAKNRRVELLLTSKIEDVVVINASASKATESALTVVKQRKAAHEAAETAKMKAREATDTFEITIMPKAPDVVPETKTIADIEEQKAAQFEVEHEEDIHDFVYP